jgi:hypothetical protein
MHLNYFIYTLELNFELGGASPPGMGGGSSYILVYTDVPLEWSTSLTSQIYQWDAIFINLLYPWVDIFACHYINGW